jgi:hypothetical protein
MVGDGVDGVIWGTGEMMFEEELAVIPFAFRSALISPSVLAIPL